MSAKEQVINIKLTSDKVSDFSNISVSRLGKNLATPQQIYVGATAYGIVEFDGRTCIKFVDNTTSQWAGIKFKENTQYTVSFDARVVKREEKDGKSGLFYFMYSDGTSTRITTERNTEWEHFSLTSEAGKTVIKIGTNTYNYVNYNYIDINSFQLEEGAVETKYESYTKQIATADSDGTVSGIKVISPKSTFFADDEQVDINIEYNADIKLYIDNKFN